MTALSTKANSIMCCCKIHSGTCMAMEVSLCVLASR